jgi:nitric oxide dioxygenase
MFTEQHKATILATVPLLRKNGVLLTKHFYTRLFNQNPDLQNVFNMGNQQNGKQQTALAMAVLAYAENIANPEVLMPVIDMIGHKHSSLDIQPTHYAVVGENLLTSIKEVLGELANDEVMEAWTLAYQQLADLMIGHEKKIYSSKETEKNGWSGWKSVKVIKKIHESEEICSFYLAPADGKGVSLHVPGQYISVRVFLPELQLLQPRQYSISCAPNEEFYRISVKKELGRDVQPNGMISNFLHDSVQVGDMVEISSPSGTFVLNENSKNKVFISGGIGQTPLLSMLETLVKKANQQPDITWIHGCRNTEVHAFQSHLKELKDTCHKLATHTFYDALAGEESADNVYEGALDLEQLKNWNLDLEAEYYVCGPAPFIKKQYEFLVANKVAKEQIFFEEFGPQALQLN